MPYIEQNDKMGIQEAYIPDWQQDLRPVQTPIDPIPGINRPQINQSISIET